MRQAFRKDIEQLVDLMEEFYAEADYKLNRKRAADAFEGLLADKHFGRIWFIEANSAVVGYVVVTLCYSMEYGGLDAFVDDFFIRAPFRGAGLGTKALQHVRAFCLSQGVRALHVETGRDNVAALAAYHRAGFVRVDRLLLTLKLAEPTHDTAKI